MLKKFRQMVSNHVDKNSDLDNAQWYVIISPITYKLRLIMAIFYCQVLIQSNAENFNDVIKLVATLNDHSNSINDNLLWSLIIFLP